MTDSVETIRCSNCKRDILSSNFLIHDVHCQRNISLCTKCNEPVNHNQKAEHDEANHSVVFCTSCHAQLEKFRLNSHLTNECPKRNVRCQICDIEIAADDIFEHENYCGARTEKCPECGEYVMLKYTQLHLDSNHTFIKLSDEPGPSPSWQNGRRTLGNFFPDLDLSNYTPQLHQKKKYVRNESSRRRAKGSPELADKDRRHEESPGAEEKEKSRHRNIERPSCSKTHDVKRRVSDGSTDRSSRRHNSRESHIRESYRDKVKVKSDDMNTGLKEYMQRGKASSPISSTSNTAKENEKELKELNDILKVVKDTSLAFAFHLSNEPTGDCQVENDRVIAQSVEKNTADLSEFSFLDSLEKKKTGKNLSKNINSGKKSSKTTMKPRLASYADDSSDDEFLLYSRKTDQDVDDAILPCQFCSALYPSFQLMDHQKLCDAFENVNISTSFLKGSTSRDESDALIPCGICSRMIPFSLYNSHMSLLHSDSLM
ncbi:UNVERIFIED_CONTAM: hypothetical protein PYX00_009078 [Menopon gallinae]|uniref:TRAFD1/XAF1 zinc finger domain-containing protein n=1 Tax=Menopon gallinae TaxID=328185 RepID=A0AAW2HAI8_9NEOP